MTTPPRQPDHPVHPMFVERWSPRAFTEATISEPELLTLLEAGRWAPSAFNVQPWRFIYARRGTPAWEPLLASVHPFNQSWAQRAAALVIVACANDAQPPGAAEPAPNPHHPFDAGAACAYIALQASLMGWNAHTMAGILKDVARERLQVPASYTLHVGMAIGRRSEDTRLLSESQRAREVPSARLPLTALASEGRFGA